MLRTKTDWHDSVKEFALPWHVLALLLLPCKINTILTTSFITLDPAWFWRCSGSVWMWVSFLVCEQEQRLTHIIFVFSRQVFLIGTVADRSDVATRTVVCPTGTLVGFCLITPFFFTLITPFFFTQNTLVKLLRQEGLQVQRRILH